MPEQVNKPTNKPATPVKDPGPSPAKVMLGAAALTLLVMGIQLRDKIFTFADKVPERVPPATVPRPIRITSPTPFIPETPVSSPRKVGPKKEPKIVKAPIPLTSPKKAQSRKVIPSQPAKKITSASRSPQAQPQKEKKRDFVIHDPEDILQYLTKSTLNELIKYLVERNIFRIRDLQLIEVRPGENFESRVFSLVGTASGGRLESGQIITKQILDEQSRIFYTFNVFVERP